MSTPTHPFRNTLTGLIAEMTEDAASSFPDILERVSEDAKPFEPGLFKPGKVGEFANDEPLTDDQTSSRAALEQVLKDHGPNSNAAKDARASVKAADDAAEQAKADAAEAEEQARHAAVALAETATTTTPEEQ